jgi:hypothetical protein
MFKTNSIKYIMSGSLLKIWMSVLAFVICTGIFATTVALLMERL